ncbi:MAG: cupin [Gammaproteobacteria bacterium]|nr:MAG: cupin [Gammaproteobacteria bacterium]TND06438.1 MAG: cupin [Gammaproteobacteria bacterium]
MATVTVYDQVQAFLTKDGSIIRELMHPVRHGNARQSLAEATVPPGTRTALHRHARSEELYYIVAGEGRMFLDHDTFAVTVGDTICIPPGTPHAIANTGTEVLRLLCCSAPPYADADTELLA